MDVETYRKRRQELAAKEKPRRELCLACFQPQFGCYCAQIERFDPEIKFVILIHPIEVKRRIATGRMSHLCLKNSELIQGEDYSANKQVEAILANPDYHNVILYPGRNAANVTPLTNEQRTELFPKDKQLVIFVIDGTWRTARKMLNRSQNLQRLPQICFTPDRSSRFRVRKQPAENYFSTIEAIHQTIELVGESQGYDVASRAHDNLLNVFDYFVELQLKCVELYNNPRQGFYFRKKTNQSIGK